MAIEGDGSAPLDNQYNNNNNKKSLGKLIGSPGKGWDMSCNEYSAYVSILSNLIKGASCFMSVELSKYHSSFLVLKKSHTVV